MKQHETIFAVPTYRLRDVAETIEKYDEHFWSNGHAVKMMVFDDSSLANHEKYYSLMRRSSFSAFSIGSCATRSWNRWSAISSGRVMGETGTLPSCIRSAPFSSARMTICVRTR